MAGIKNNNDVDIEINGVKTDVKMKINKHGRALFEKVSVTIFRNL
jgi:phosphatidate phosphatase PAH1